MVAGSAGTAERRGAGGAGQRFIPVNDTGPRLQQQLVEFVAFGGDQPAGKPETGRISEGNRLIKMVIAPDAEQRAEDLFVSHLCNFAHVDNARRQQRGSGLQQARLQQGFAAAGHVC